MEILMLKKYSVIVKKPVEENIKQQGLSERSVLV